LKNILASACVRTGFALALGAAGLALTLYGTRIVAAQVPDAPTSQAAAADTALQNAGKLVNAGQFQQASDVLRLFLQAEPKSATAHTLLAYSLLRLNDPKSSLAEYTLASAIEPPSAVDLQNVAKDYVLLGDLSDADHWASIAVHTDDRDAEAWYGLGRIRYSLQRFQDAADCFQRVLALAPRSVKAENNLGLAYEGLNRTEDAVEAYRQAIQWQQNAASPSEQPLLNLGIFLLHQGKLPEAQVLLTQAVAIAPRDPRIREQLGHLYLQLNQFQEAQRQFEEAIALRPDDPSLHFMLGKALHQEGQEQKAKSEFARSAALSGYHSTPAPN
jgi:Flp pilus assembly protein TadD